VTVVPREYDDGARCKSAGPRTVPVRAALVRLYADYLHGEDGDPLASDYVFVALLDQAAGRPPPHLPQSPLLTTAPWGSVTSRSIGLASPGGIALEVDSVVGGSSIDLVSSLVVAAIAFTVGAFRQEVVIRFRTRKTRKYWQPFKSRGLTLVIGSDLSPANQATSPDHIAYRPLDTSALYEFEPYGLVGLGDVLALMTLQEHLRMLNFSDLLIVHSNAAQLTSSHRNLILIGGPDSNRLTNLAMQSLRVPVSFVPLADDRTGLRDDETGTVYEPQFSSQSSLVLTRDFGFVAQGQSPFSEDSMVVLLSGTYGAATASAASLVTSAAGVSRILKVKKRKCLTIFSVSIVGNHLATPKVISARPID
jgi:hypothetical protein